MRKAKQHPNRTPNGAATSRALKPSEDGGRTDSANLHPLCTRHHQLKTHGGWLVTRDDETGCTIWTSPMGRVYVVDPEPVLIPPVRLVEPDPDPPPF